MSSWLRRLALVEAAPGYFREANRIRYRPEHFTADQFEQRATGVGPPHFERVEY